MKIQNKIFYVSTGFGLLLIIGGIYLIATSNPESDSTIKLFGQELESNNVGIIMCFLGVVFCCVIFKDILKKKEENITPESAIRLTEEKLSKNLKDTLALAEFLSKRDGKNVTSTRYFFKAVEIINPFELSGLLEILMEKQALPKLNEEDKSLGNSDYSLDINRTVSNCITDSLENLDNIAKNDNIDDSDLFIDVAKYGKGSSVARLRKHGVTPSVIDNLTEQFGIKVKGRN